jgi:S-adenosylmethionine:tRNA ribosyltransferase-isomerase
VHKLLDDVRLGVCVLESFEPCVDPSPSGGHEVHEESEVVHAGVTLCEEIAFEPLEPPNRLVQEASYLGDVARDREHLGADAVADRGRDVLGDRRLELGRRHGQCLDLTARALECRLDRRRVRSARRGVGNPLLRTLEGERIHGRRGYSQRRMDTALLDYELPEALIAQRPIEPRDASRLLVYRRESGQVEHMRVSDLPDLLDGELVVVNDSRVVPGRLSLRRASGGAVELLLLERLDDNGRWEALARPSKRLREGEVLGPVRLDESRGEGRWIVSIAGDPHGDVPLPPYIRSPLADPDRYQTVYAAVDGSAAAPTAGLHLTPELVGALEPARVTLHVGLDTFRPVVEDRVEEHRIHGELYAVEEATWARIASAERVLAIGTTTVRVLETVARTGDLVGRTSLFITPGFAFRRVDALMTNFHLPRSTLLALVMAFVGVEATRGLYEEAIARGYRFYSFGDAMLVL